MFSDFDTSCGNEDCPNRQALYVHCFNSTDKTSAQCSDLIGYLGCHSFIYPKVNFQTGTTSEKKKRKKKKKREMYFSCFIIFSQQRTV